MKDPYEILGVARTASSDDIRKAYRRLAKKLHPDLNPGDREAEERFKEVSHANDLLSDLEKRQKFDAGEIDASGSEQRRQRFYKDFAAEAAPGHAYENYGGFADFAESDDLIAELLRRQARESRRARGGDLHYRLTIEFLEAVNGAAKRLTLPGGGILDVTIPPGIQEGQTLRLRGKGASPLGTGDVGDALVQVLIKPHHFFRRKDYDIHVELPVSLAEAVRGAHVPVPTITGQVSMRVPKGSNTGTVLRLKGKGVARTGGHGDELVRLNVMLPPTPDPELEAFVSGWKTGNEYDPRRDMQP